MCKQCLAKKPLSGVFNGSGNCYDTTYFPQPVQIRNNSVRILCYVRKHEVKEVCEERELAYFTPPLRPLHTHMFLYMAGKTRRKPLMEEDVLLVFLMHSQHCNRFPFYKHSTGAWATKTRRGKSWRGSRGTQYILHHKLLTLKEAAILWRHIF